VKTTKHKIERIIVMDDEETTCVTLTAWEDGVGVDLEIEAHNSAQDISLDMPMIEAIMTALIANPSTKGLVWAMFHKDALADGKN
jgi:hypothetical protein